MRCLGHTCAVVRGESSRVQVDRCVFRHSLKARTYPCICCICNANTYRSPSCVLLQNVGESRIPVPRAARPSFFPKSRVLGTPSLIPGHRHSLILSGCMQFVDAEDEASTPNPKCGTRNISTPTIEGNRKSTVFLFNHETCNLTIVLFVGTSSTQYVRVTGVGNRKR